MAAWALPTEADNFRNRMPQYKEENYDANAQLLELVRQLAAEKNATPARISLAWMLCRKPYIVPIPGSRKTERLRENFEAGNIVLSAQEVAGIDARLDSIPTSGVFGGSPVKQ